MYSSMRIISIESRLFLFTLVVSLCLCVSGCWTKRWTEFNPIKQEQPIIMFDSYLLHISGLVTKAPTMDIEVSFIRKITDTTYLDTIPVFIIDSVCFHGSCLDSSFCSKPIDWCELNELIKKEQPYFIGYDFGTPLSYKDLWYEDGKLKPISYYLDPSVTIPFPSACTDTSITVEIRACILDRLTGKELARESKTLRFLIEPKEKRIILSQSTIPKKVLSEQKIIRKNTNS